MSEPSHGGDGWYYDDFTTDTQDSCGMDGQRISYTTGDEPVTGTDVRLECLQPVQQLPGTEATDITIGSSCATGCGSVVGFELTCAPSTNTCQQECGNDADCSTRGLAGWRCGDADGVDGGPKICQNPTCG